ncbi:carbohydrate ABC transporter permease [Brevibacillus choshinensis]|uniref:Sugar ABC transporter permease n=1 Tax=Brevibacillus choshinensis TaxID=54911 RepID=A0ABX7FV97_BRECH|nr:sugar ABC transporter permease [Brevibacillus choshinensis]QRG70174.1 sugar ABC transporter permease [Brevibacillus choshinensis]
MQHARNQALWMMTPLAVVVIALVAFPTLYAYFVSVHDARLSGESASFLGLNNYASMLTNPSFYGSIYYSAKFALFATAAELVVGICLAVLFNRKFRGKGIFTSLLLLPLMVAPSLFALIFRLMLNEFVGIVPYYLNLWGITVNPFDPAWVNVTLVAIDAMQWIPFVFIIVYAGLTTIPEELYEAARVDGANPIQSFFRITLPLLVPTLTIVAFLRAIDSFKIYDMIYVLTNGGPGELTTSVSLFIYKKAFLEGNIGEATAASVLLTFLLAPVLALSMKFIVRRGA